jgi:peptidoglycan/LPS O-acetylase OafA/YrhL
MRQLDALRAFAVVAVIIHHYLPAFADFVPLGALGVQLFFVLSGFLITGILLDCRRSVESGEVSRSFTIRRFYARRFLRIFPLFYFVLAAAIAFDFKPARETWLWHVTYLTNVYIFETGNWPGPLAPFWSLAVEEQFYLVWPWVILWTPRRVLPAVVVSVVMLAPLVRLVGELAGLDPAGIGVLPFACLDTLGLGALLALTTRSDWSGLVTRTGLERVGLLIGVPLLAANLAVLALGQGMLLTRVTLGVALGLAGAWLVSRAARGFGGSAGRLLELRPLLYIGTISYGVYVYHSFVPNAAFAVLDFFRRPPAGPVMLVGIAAGSITMWWVLARCATGTAWARRVLPALRSMAIGAALVLVIQALRRLGLPVDAANVATGFVAACALTFVVASLSWELFERPINDLKRYYSYKPAPRREALPAE